MPSGGGGAEPAEVVALGHAGAGRIALLAAGGVHDPVAAAEARLDSARRRAAVAVASCCRRRTPRCRRRRRRRSRSRACRCCCSRRSRSCCRRRTARPGRRCRRRSRECAGTARRSVRQPAGSHCSPQAAFTIPSPQRRPVSIVHVAEQPSQSSVLPSSHSSPPQTTPSPQPVTTRAVVAAAVAVVGVAVVALLAGLDDARCRTRRAAAAARA